MSAGSPTPEEKVDRPVDHVEEALVTRELEQWREIVEELLRHRPIEVPGHEWTTPEEEAGYRLALQREVSRLQHLLSRALPSQPEQGGEPTGVRCEGCEREQHVGDEGWESRDMLDWCPDCFVEEDDCQDQKGGEGWPEVILYRGQGQSEPTSIVKKRGIKPDGIKFRRYVPAPTSPKAEKERDEALKLITEAARNDETVGECLKACIRIARRARGEQPKRKELSDVQPGVLSRGSEGRDDCDPRDRRAADQAPSGREGDVQAGDDSSNKAELTLTGGCRIAPRDVDAALREEGIDPFEQAAPGSPKALLERLAGELEYRASRQREVQGAALRHSTGEAIADGQRVAFETAAQRLREEAEGLGEEKPSKLTEQWREEAREAAMHAAGANEEEPGLGDFNGGRAAALRQAADELDTYGPTGHATLPPDDGSLHLGLARHRFKDEAMWLRNHGHVERAEVVEGWAALPPESQEGER